MLGYQSYQHRRIFDVDGTAIRDVLLGHWAATGIHMSPEQHDGWLHELSELILCGCSENDLAEKLAACDRQPGAAPDLYACHLTARALLAL